MDYCDENGCQNRKRTSAEPIEMPNNKQLTAVEWFFEQLTEVDYNCINKTFLQNDNSLAGYRLRGLLEQAKEMEKEQHRVTAEDFYYGNWEYKKFRDYYEQTYGGGEQ
jgi:hypothetical protein